MSFMFVLSCSCFSSVFFFLPHSFIHPYSSSLAACTILFSFSYWNGVRFGAAAAAPVGRSKIVFNAHFFMVDIFIFAF